MKQKLCGWLSMQWVYITVKTNSSECFNMEKSAIKHECQSLYRYICRYIIWFVFLVFFPWHTPIVCVPTLVRNPNFAYTDTIFWAEAKILIALLVKITENLKKYLNSLKKNWFKENSKKRKKAINLTSQYSVYLLTKFKVPAVAWAK